MSSSARSSVNLTRAPRRIAAAVSLSRALASNSSTAARFPPPVDPDDVSFPPRVDVSPPVARKAVCTAPPALASRAIDAPSVASNIPVPAVIIFVRERARRARSRASSRADADPPASHRATREVADIATPTSLDDV